MNDGYYALLLAIIYDLRPSDALDYIKGNRRDYENLVKIEEFNYQLDIEDLMEVLK